MSFLSPKLGIDLGTTTTLVFVPGTGIVLNEPSVVAVSATDRKILAIGTDAKEMVGRTPEYLGKKIQAAEMKLVVLYLLTVPTLILVFASVSVVLDTAKDSILNRGAHGLSEVVYAFTSAANNNGSAFAFQDTSTQWYTVTQGLAMLMGRFLLVVPALAIAGSLAGKPTVPVTSGTLPTHTPLFGGLLAGVVIVVAGLTFFPALALGPILEHLSL